jgi:hypothetical protein
MQPCEAPFRKSDSANRSLIPTSIVQEDRLGTSRQLTSVGSRSCAMLKLWSFPENHTMCGLRISAVPKITGLGASGTVSWEEGETPKVASFERARKTLQAPKCLRLGPLLDVAAVASALPITQDFLERHGLNPSARGAPGSDEIHEMTWLQTVLGD